MQLAEQVRLEQESRREMQEEVRNWERVGARLQGQIQDMHLQLQRRVQELKNTKDELQQYQDEIEVRKTGDIVSLNHQNDMLLFVYQFINYQYLWLSYMSLVTSFWCHGSFVFCPCFLFCLGEIIFKQ
jgi:hypothetical protein